MTMRPFRKLLGLTGAIALVSAALAVAPDTASAATYGFTNISTNDKSGPPYNYDTGSQYQVEVTQGANANQASFTFKNLGPALSSITDVYFQDGTLLGAPMITNSPGVVFGPGATPADLPGAGSVNFIATAGFSASSTSPPQPNGVNPGEQVTITFDLINGKTYLDTIAALDGGTALRIGIKVQGFADNGSEGFVNGPPTNPVPEPSTLALGLGAIGLLGLARLRRRRHA